MRVPTGKALIVGVTAVTLAVATACSSSGGNSGNNGNNGTNGGTGSSSNVPNGGTLIFGEGTDYTENLMPLISAGNATSTANLEVRLLNGPFQITPKIAYQADPTQVTGEPTSQVQNGQQVVTYEINPKAVWDDGQKITAADYVYTWQAQRSADPKDGGCASLLGTTGYDQMESVKQGKNDHEVVVTYKKGQSFPDWQGMFSPLLSAHVFMPSGTFDAKASCDYITKGWPVADGIPAGATNGPWLLTKSNINVPQKTFTLVHNPKWWGQAPHLDKLVDANIGNDPGTNVKALQNQEVNMIYPQPQLDLVGNLKQLSNVTTEVNFGVAFEHFDFNTADPLLSHKEIRQAIAYAIDRPALVQGTVGKFSDKASVLGNRFLMGNQTGYEDHSGPYAHQDVAKAKSLLEGIGCKMGAGNIYTCFGKQLKFTVSTTQNNPLRDSTITLAAQQVKAAGIQLSEFADPDIFAGADKPHSLEAEGFQIALFAWVGGPSISSNASIYLTKSKGGGQNYSQGSTPEIDSVLNKMKTATTSQDAIKFANQADQLLWDQMYTLPLYQKPDLLAYDSSFGNIGDNATQAGPLWNSETFYQKS